MTRSPATGASSGRQGLVISAERRIGKTHIVRKMQDECQSGYLPFYQDLEAVHTTPELIRSIYETVRESLDTVLRLCRHQAPSLVDEHLHEILTVLAQDHYIEPRRLASGVAYDFRWRLVKRWWRERRP